MNFRLTAGVLVVLAILGVAVYFSEFKDRPSGAAAEPTKSADQAKLEIWRFDDKETQSVSVDRGDVTAVVERTEEDRWVLQPSGEPADRIRISSLLIRLSTLSATRRITDEPTNLEQYGLIVPRLVATITQKDGARYHLVVGGKGPADVGTYVKRADEPTVFLMANQLVGDIEKMVSEPPKEPPTPTPAPTSTATPTPTEPEPTPAEAPPSTGY